VGYANDFWIHYGLEPLPWDPVQIALHQNQSAIDIDRASLAQLEAGGHTSTNRQDDTEATKLRLRAGIAKLEAARTILRAQL